MQDTKLLCIRLPRIVYASATPCRVSAVAFFVVSVVSSVTISVVGFLAASAAGIGVLVITINYIADIGAAVIKVKAVV